MSDYYQQCGWPGVSPNIHPCVGHFGLMSSEERMKMNERIPDACGDILNEVAARDCKHGQLARSCNICELQAELDYAKATNWYKDVRAFHEKFGCYIAAKPGFPSPEVTKLRTDLFLEECKELSEAMKREDIVETADAFADLIYVTIGWALACGIPLDKVWAEVQKSNMLKDGGATRADGKILKPEGWVAPDIKSIIDEASK